MPILKSVLRHVDLLAGIEDDAGQLGDHLPRVLGRERHDDAPVGGVLRSGGGWEQAGDDKQGGQSIHDGRSPAAPAQDSGGTACLR